GLSEKRVSGATGFRTGGGGGGIQGGGRRGGARRRGSARRLGSRTRRRWTRAARRGWPGRGTGAAPEEEGAMTTTTAEVRSGSKASAAVEIPGFRGRLIGPGHADYDAARAVWNGAIDRRPRLIARCIGAADVVAAVRF